MLGEMIDERHRLQREPWVPRRPRFFVTAKRWSRTQFLNCSRPPWLTAPACCVFADQGLLPMMIGIIAMTGSPLSLIGNLLLSASLTHCTCPRHQICCPLLGFHEGALFFL